MKQDQYEFEQKIKGYIKKSGRSQAATARRLGYDPSTLNKWIQGINHISLNALQDLCNLLELDESQRAELLSLGGYDVLLRTGETATIQNIYRDYSAVAGTGGTATINIFQQTQLAPGAAPPPPNLFVGRDEDIAELYRRLTSQTEITLLTAVRGWPGVGKTTLAAAAAHDVKLHEVFPEGVLWTALGPEPNLLFGLGEWLMALGDDPRPHTSTEGRSKRLAALLRDKQMLLIIDDVWDAANARPFCVGGIKCRTLITTRHPEVARDLGLPDQAVYLLEILTDEEALDLLHQLAPKAVDLEPGGTQRLVKELEGLPLALQVAGRLLAAEAAMGWGINDLLEELAQGKRILEAKAPADRTDVAKQSTPTVAALFQQSTNRLDEITRERFALLSIFVSKPATFDAPAAGAALDVKDPKPTLRILVDRGLLEPAGGGRFQIHALLTAHAKSMLEEE